MLDSSRVITLKLQTKGEITEEQEKPKDVKERTERSQNGSHVAFVSKLSFIFKLTVPKI